MFYPNTRMWLSAKNHHLKRSRKNGAFRSSVSPETTTESGKLSEYLKSECILASTSKEYKLTFNKCIHFCFLLTFGLGKFDFEFDQSHLIKFPKPNISFR